MASDGVVLLLPIADDHPGMSQRPEAGDVQALVSDSAVEGLHVAIAPRGTGWDVVDTGDLSGPVGHGLADQFRAVVASQDLRQPPLRGDSVEVGGEVVTGDAAGHDPAQAFAGVLIDDRGDLDRPACLVGVELEVHRPHHIRRAGLWGFCGGGPHAFASTFHRHPQALFTPEPLDLLMGLIADEGVAAV